MEANADDVKTQYGVQLIYTDPKAAGAPEGVEPRWYAFYSLEQADAFVRHYRCRIGDQPGYRPDWGDPDEMWQDNKIADIKRATRQAIEKYGDWEQ